MFFSEINNNMIFSHIISEGNCSGCKQLDQPESDIFAGDVFNDKSSRIMKFTFRTSVFYTLLRILTDLT